MADRNEFHNDLEVYCSAREHYGAVLDLIRVYGPTASLKDVMTNIKYQLDKYEDLLFTHEYEEAKTVVGAVMSLITQSEQKIKTSSVEMMEVSPQVDPLGPVQ